jgi:hypothetical protein
MITDYIDWIASTPAQAEEIHTLLHEINETLTTINSMEEDKQLVAVVPALRVLADTLGTLGKSESAVEAANYVLSLVTDHPMSVDEMIVAAQDVVWFFDTRLTAELAYHSPD